jgi:hypothetical protein
MKNWTLEKHELSPALLSVSLDGEHITSILKEGSEQYLEKLKQIENPSFCSMCGKVHEYSDQDAFRQQKRGVWYHYCGCRGWD